MGKLTKKIAIFDGYVKLPEGTPSDVPAARIMNSRAKATRCRSPADNVAVQSRTSWCREQQRILGLDGLGTVGMPVLQAPLS